MAQTAIHIGVSGWRYAPWRGRFYPKDLPQRAELEYAARCFSSIEINGSFYSLQSPRSWQAWYEATPENFVFGVKGPAKMDWRIDFETARTSPIKVK